MFRYVLLFLFSFLSASQAHAFGAKRIFLASSDAKKDFDLSASFAAFDSVVRFTIHFPNGSDGQCAGLLLKGGYLLSARHCVEPLFAPIAGYDEALPRKEFLQRVEGYEQKQNLTFPITIFLSTQERPVDAHLALLGAGLTVVNTPEGIKHRLVRAEETQSGSEADWALLDIGMDLNPNCIPLSSADYQQADRKVFVVGAPLENPSYVGITGNEIRVSEGQTVDTKKGSDLLIQDDVLDGAKVGSVNSSIYEKTGYSSAPVLPGFSGGAVLDAGGAYLGVTSFMYSHFQGSGYAPITEIKRQWIEDQSSLPRGSVDDFFCR